VSVVASAMQNGTSRIRARVLARSVLPDPVGPIKRILLFSISTSANGSGWNAAEESVGDDVCRTRLKCLCTDTESVFLATSCPISVRGCVLAGHQSGRHRVLSLPCET